MALKKTIELSNGYSVEYHNVQEVHFDKKVKKCVVQVGLYKNEAARIANKEPVKIKCFVLSNMESSNLDLVYTKLKLQPDFIGSEDI